MLTFETAAVQGVAGIIDKLTVCLPLCSSFADLIRCPVTSILQSPAPSLNFGCATFERNWWNTCGSDRSLTGMESSDSKVPNPGGVRVCWSRMNGWHAREPRLTKNNGQWIIHRCFNCSQTALAVTSSSTISSSWYTHSRRSAGTPKLSGLNSYLPISHFGVVVRGYHGLNIFRSFQRGEMKPFDSPFSKSPRTPTTSRFLFQTGFCCCRNFTSWFILRPISAPMFRWKPNLRGRIWDIRS